jgi:hypothetical protein
VDTGSLIACPIPLGGFQPPGLLDSVRFVAITKLAACYTFRHSCATHLVENRYDNCSNQALGSQGCEHDYDLYPRFEPRAGNRPQSGRPARHHAGSGPGTACRPSADRNRPHVPAAYPGYVSRRAGIAVAFVAKRIPQGPVSGCSEIGCNGTQP